MDLDRLRRLALSAMVGMLACAGWLLVATRFLGTGAVLLTGAVLAWGLGAWAADRTNRRNVLVRTIRSNALARVVRDLGPLGKVEIGGELWSARTPTGETVAAGEEVEILARHGLLLSVLPRARPTGTDDTGPISPRR